MFNKLKMLFCDHVYSTQEDSRNIRDNLDKLIIEATCYKCEKCGKQFTVIDKINREKNFYKGLN